MARTNQRCALRGIVRAGDRGTGPSNVRSLSLSAESTAADAGRWARRVAPGHLK